MYRAKGLFVMGFNGQTAESVLMESDYHRKYFSKFHWYSTKREFSKNSKNINRRKKDGHFRSKSRW